MKQTCPVCGKEFWCDYPNQWIYKRKGSFICSWSCIREYDRKEAEKMEQEKQRKKPGRKPMKPEGPKVELVYDESIAEEYRREQERKAAETEILQVQDEKDVWHVSAVRNREWGEFYYDEKCGTIDWRHPGGEEVSLPVVDWRRLPDLIPMILIHLGLGD